VGICRASGNLAWNDSCNAYAIFIKGFPLGAKCLISIGFPEIENPRDCQFPEIQNRRAAAVRIPGIASGGRRAPCDPGSTAQLI